MSNQLKRLLAVLLLASPILVYANSTNYGKFTGITLVYSNVTETATMAGDSVPLFGAPQLSGDSLLFTHMTFNSQAANGASDITDGLLDAHLSTKNNPQFYIDSLTFREFGDTTLAGTGTTNTYSSVAANLYITIWETNRVALLFPEIITLNMTVSDGGKWTLAGGPLTGKSWNGLATVDLTGYLQSQGIMGQATSLDFRLENTLASGSELNTSALIAKKLAGLRVDPGIIPEPGVVSLLVFLFGGLLIRRRR